ncbi:GIY-YIG nuclease family protein [Burkholderia sp. L27(2015)]|uniref:GIY-YIG nuclease family protein n=1 Tax=Burkholderia sp. L27(2015) TaxID=1641858 RepID=UPI00131D9FD2|nr:GIY-YIG nuclease family protein [Burkholderia sp. L27(2015)]
MPEVAGGERFHLIEFVRKIIDKHFSIEQQSQTYKKKQSEGYETVGKALRFYIPFIAHNTGQLTRLGNGWFQVPSEGDDELEDAAEDSLEALPNGEAALDYNGSVYAFSFPELIKAGEPFPIKVGRTQLNVEARVVDQCKKSASFSNPVILGQWQTARVEAFEHAIHNVLTSRGKWRKDVPGTEWFDTTLEEVESIVAFIRDN